MTWAIINGEQETGFTYHYINKECDTGKIILQKKINIEIFDTQETLYTRVMFESMKSFKKAFDLVAEGYSGIEQNGSFSYFPRGCPHDGEIDENWDYEYKARFIRAMTYPPYPSAKFKGKKNYLIEDIKNLII